MTISNRWIMDICRSGRIPFRGITVITMNREIPARAGYLLDYAMLGWWRKRSSVIARHSWSTSALADHSCKCQVIRSSSAPGYSIICSSRKALVCLCWANKTLLDTLKLALDNQASVCEGQFIYLHYITSEILL